MYKIMINKLKKLSKYQNILIIVADIMCIVASYIMGLLIITTSFSEMFSEYYIKRTSTIIAISIVVYQIIFHIAGSYKHIIRYEEAKDYAIYMILSVVSSGIIIVFRQMFRLPIVSRRLIFLASLFIGLLMVSYRVFIRFLLVYDDQNAKEMSAKNSKNLLIIGAGNAAHEIIKTIHQNLRSEYNIIGIIDDNKRKKNYTISGVKILGNRNDIINVCKEKKVDIIFFSIANIDVKNKKDILRICQETNAKVRILPGIKEIIRDKKLIDNLRDVEIEDILGREPVKLGGKNIEEIIKGRVVLVTGAGGSIGSELCRQIIKFNPKNLVMLDIYENNLYDIQQELKRSFPKKNITTVIASIRDEKRLDEIFSKYNPYLVFHAAAHKHVPLMEESPIEAIKNNIFGTYNVINVCDKYKVKRFIQISTDKAVNPTNIMGATKRMCEMMVQAKNSVSDTEYVAVRFGNVLGSNGSVVPLFKKQIAEGGPVTVTHKEITRFFMTIPEASSLVLQAIADAKGGEIFVLDMGKPVKIYDLAVSLIKLSGYVPNEDIEIKITGLRPGEKLYEELLMGEEGLQKTENDKIFVAKPMDITMNEITSKLDKFNEIIENENLPKEKIIEIFKENIPTYMPEKGGN